MAPSYVFVLHSGDGYYTDDLVGNALRCLHAVQRSVRAASPDFVPTTAVLFADPHRGIECVYSSAVPDRNHSLDRVAATHPSLTDAAGAVFSSEEGQTAEQQMSSFAQLFRLRSHQLLQDAVLQAAQAHNNTVATEATVKASSSPVKGFKSLTTEVSSSTATAAVDMWGSLAGALLAATCFLRAHPSSAFRVASAEEGDASKASAGTAAQQEAGAGNGTGHAGPPPPPPRSAGSVVVFSDADVGGAAPPPYSAECALAVAAVTASKMGVPVSCFGGAVATAAETAATNRLTALAASLGGVCAARFRLQDLGQLLDGASAAATRVGTGVRQRRDRIASQYIVGPTMLPLTPSESAGAQGGAVLPAASPPSKRSRTESGGAPCVSHMGWLCPSCMAVVHRHLGDSSAAPATEDSAGGGGGGADHQVGPPCPYCRDV